MVPGLVGSGTLKQKLSWSVRDTHQSRPFETQGGRRDGRQAEESQNQVLDPRQKSEVNWEPFDVVVVLSH